ncbi:serine protease [Datura stramonium]|uniref:Serine protease n=1 Tax=Datura stramonium TaxID=4076 RepID=A0ABS8VHP7_DATST|nr:serine protease [Datura stramonium]
MIGKPSISKQLESVSADHNRMDSQIWLASKDNKFSSKSCVEVHDFGFFRYDPAAVQFLSYEEIPLAPDAASVGVEIRVVGNDSGEKVWPWI